LRGEQYSTVVGSSQDGQVLIALGQEQIYPFRFSPRSGASTGVLCGACPPTALERGADGIRIFLPVRRQLSPASVTPPMAYDASSARTAGGACTGEHMVVAYLSGDRVLAQRTRPGEWRFERPTVLAEPDQHGKPVELAVIGFDDRVLVVWRRATARNQRLRIEATPLEAR
jgi:hypothetical protein